MRMSKRLDERTIHLVVLIIFAGALIALERVFTQSLEGFLFALLPTLLLVVFYLMLSQRTTDFEQFVKEALESHIPDVAFIRTSESIESEFVDAVRSADKFIMTTGGKSRIKEYLAAIETYVEEKGLEYYRVLFGGSISEELYKHVTRIVGKDGVYISYVGKDLGPTLLVTDKVALVGLPHPRPDEFSMCMRIPSQDVVHQLEKYVRVWHETGAKIRGEEDMAKLITDLRILIK
jgi:hypothetical protein